MSWRRSCDGPVLDLTPDQVREARRLLGWRQKDLAQHAGLSVSTVIHHGQGISVRVQSKAAIGAALATAGIAVDDRGQVTLRRSR